jgi:hypothetical protein
LVNNSGHVVREVAGTPWNIVYDDPPRRDPYRRPATKAFDPFVVLAEDLGVGGGAEHELDITGS